MAEDNNNELHLDVPDHLSYSEEHVWMDDSVDPVVLGITEYATEQLGDIVFVDLPEPGTEVQAGDEIAQIESSKSVEPFVCPVAGTVRYVNRAIADDPDVIGQDPYGEGWFVKIELDDDEPELLTADEYVKIIK